MARLIVDAISDTHSTGGGYQVDSDTYVVYFGVSVSRADDGSPVSGLDKGNFRFCIARSGWSVYADLTSYAANEAKWDPDDIEYAGVYTIMATLTSEPLVPPMDEELWVAIQARTFTDQGDVVDMGQALIRCWTPPEKTEAKVVQPHPRPRAEGRRG